MFFCQELVDIFEACPPDDECPEFLTIEDTTADEECCELLIAEGAALPDFC